MVKLTENKSRTISRLGIDKVFLGANSVYSLFGVPLTNIKYIEEYLCPTSMEYQLRWITHSGQNNSYRYPEGGMTEDQLTTLLVTIRLS